MKIRLLAFASAGDALGATELDLELAEGSRVGARRAVAGGRGEPLRAELVDGPIDTGRAVAAVSGPGRGAVVVFLGTVRDHHAGRPVEKLTYSAYRAMALEGLGRIVADLEGAHKDLRAAIVHRLGEVA